MNKNKVSICIACYKQDPFLTEAVASIEMQDYPNIEICIYDDLVGVGTGEAFNRAIAKATGDIIVLLCSDDVFTDPHVISDIVDAFKDSAVSHVTRYYFQFVDGDKKPVRAWRGCNVLELGNNPSGLAFRSTMLPQNPFTNKIFVEVAYAVKDILRVGGTVRILPYDTVAVRIHKSISRTPGYYQKMFTTSPVLEWAKLGWKSTDFTSLIQIKTNFTTKAVCNEILNFIRVHSWNILLPNVIFSFLFYSVVSLVTPRRILFIIPEIYRKSWGRWTTRKVKRL